MNPKAHKARKKKRVGINIAVFLQCPYCPKLRKTATPKYDQISKILDRNIIEIRPTLKLFKQ